MRLSKRERFLLAVLTLLLLWTGFYKFWIEPETDLLFANLQEINRLEEHSERKNRSNGAVPRENRTWNRRQKNWNKPETDRSILQI